MFCGPSKKETRVVTAHSKETTPLRQLLYRKQQAAPISDNHQIVAAYKRVREGQQLLDCRVRWRALHSRVLAFHVHCAAARSANW